MVSFRTRKIENNLALYVVFFALFFQPYTTHAIPLQISIIDYPPYVQKKTPNKGLAADLIQEAFRAEKVDIEFVFHPAKRGINLVAKGKIFATLATVPLWPKKSLNQITPVHLYNVPLVALYRKDRMPQPSFKKLSDLERYKIGAIRGGADEFLLNRSQSLNVINVDSLSQLFKLVSIGRLDLFFSADLSSQKHLKEKYNGDPNLWGMTQDVMTIMRVHLMISKKHKNSEKYHKLFKQGLNNIRTNGAYKKTLERYYGEGQVPLHVMDEQQKEYIIPNN